MREAELPSFYTKMAFKEIVSELLNQGLQAKPSLFLIDLTITDSQKIIVTLDGDEGVTLQDCIDISRAIEHNLDREEVDFGLEVASAGVSSPLKLPRQYKKNIGRILKVKTTQGDFEAKLDSVTDKDIVLSWTAREPKKIGKGKETVEKTVVLPFSDIKEAIVTITF
jgi:ribosome maturation factor RimP